MQNSDKSEGNINVSAPKDSKDQPTSKASSSGSSTSRNVSRSRNMWIIHVCPTTGGQLHLPVHPEDSVENLKRYLSGKLKMSKERMSLLYKDRLLTTGTIRQNGIIEGAKLTLLPNIESGLISHKSESSVIQALEGLSDSQVNEFLSGRSPLTLAMRLGDHMMFIQLQLSSNQLADSTHSHHYRHHNHHRHGSTSSSPRHGSTSSSSRSSSSSSTSSSPPPSPPPSPASLSPPESPVFAPEPMLPDTEVAVSKDIPKPLVTLPSVDPSRSTPESPPLVLRPSPLAAVPSTSPCPGPSARHRVMNMSTLHAARGCSASPTMDSSNNSPASPLTSAATPVATPADTPTPAAASSPLSSATSASLPSDSLHSTSPFPFLDSKTILNASKTLQSKLQQFKSTSAPVPPRSPRPSPPSSPPHWSTSGATIESMYNHGAGVYSGTFSGTLNPSLQDRQGKPLRNVSTIFHILNDLLGASPQYRAHLAQQQQQQHQKQMQQHRHHHHRHSHHNRHHRHRHSSSSSHHQRKLSSHAKSLGERTRRLSEENRATKGKMIQIQQKMRERRMRLQAKREAKTTSQYPPTNYSPNSKKKHLSSSSKSTSRKPATKDAPAIKSTDTQMSATAVSDATDVTMAGDTSSAMYEDYKPGAMVA